MSKSLRKYTNEFKREAVKLALQKPSISSAAKDLGIPAATLHGWVSTLKENKQSLLPNQANTLDPDVLLEENRRLHKENAILKEEKDILKKAAAYFAQHQK